MNDTAQAALAVMFKPPVPGRVKTRLVPPLSAEQAAELHRCMVMDTFDRVCGTSAVDVVAAVAPDASGKGSNGLEPGGVPPGVDVIRQRGDGLGDRIYNVMADLSSRGYRAVVVIGSDSPDLPDGYIEEAVGALSSPGVDMVIGPAEDGGYVLVGMKAPRPEPFTGISWGTPSVCSETLERAEAAGICASLISAWRDIDTPEEIALLERNGRAPRSAAFVESLERKKT